MLVASLSALLGALYLGVDASLVGLAISYSLEVRTDFIIILPLKHRHFNIRLMLQWLWHNVNNNITYGVVVVVVVVVVTDVVVLLLLNMSDIFGMSLEFCLKLSHHVACQ